MSPALEYDYWFCFVALLSSGLRGLKRHRNYIIIFIIRIIIIIIIIVVIIIIIIIIRIIIIIIIKMTIPIGRQR